MKHLPPFSTRFAGAIVLALAAACGDSRPTAPPVSPGGPSAAISDGSSSGNPDFFFLPPLARDPSQNPEFESGKFNPNLAPVVRVCRLDATTLAEVQLASTCAANGTLVTFSGPQVELSTDAYKVLWNLRTAVPEPHLYYRIQVFVGTVRLGFLDVSVATSQGEARNARTGEVIPLPENRTLPIQFRIEQGALGACKGSTECTEASVTAQGGTFFTSNNRAALVLTPGWASPEALAAGGGSIALTIERRPTGTACHAGALGSLYQQQEPCFHYATSPDIGPYGGFQTTGNFVAQCSTVPRTEENSGDEWLLFKSDPGRPLQPLATRPTPEGLQCENFAFMEQLPANPVLRLASLGWHAVSQGIGKVVGVKLAYALDLGLGGSLLAGDDFSDISWGKAAVKAKVSGDAQSVTVGTAVTPKVKLTGFHHGDNVSGIPVTFIAQTGTLLVSELPLSTTTVITDASGEASIPWTLALGANTLKVTAPTLNPDTLTFTATGQPLAQANLIVSSLTRSLENPTVADSFYIYAQVQNTGPGVAPPSTMTLKIGNESILPKPTVTALQPGQIASMTWAVGRNLAQTHTAVVTVDADNTVAETNEGDNSAQMQFGVSALTASITDPAGDATDTGEGSPVSPDLVSADATVDGGTLVLQLRFAPETFNSQTSMASVSIDIDQTPATGFAGVDGANSDAALMGVEYVVSAGGDYIGSQPSVSRFTTSGWLSSKAGSISYVTNGMNVTIPLSALGNDRGRMNFKVGVQRQLNPGVDGYTGILDYMTNIGSAPGVLGPPPPVIQ